MEEFFLLLPSLWVKTDGTRQVSEVLAALVERVGLRGALAG